MPSSAERDDPSALTDLRLLEEVSWRGAAVNGSRSHALLAALALAGGRTVPEAALVDQVWGDPPANPAKALQVVVSRTRAQTAPEVVVRAGPGYRLGLVGARVDALVLDDALAAAVAAEAAGDALAARDHARRAVAMPAPTAAADGAIGDLRERARCARDRATTVLGRALAALGDHDRALPLLESAASDDEASTMARLRSLAAVRGVPAALDAWEQHRAGLADRLGVDPGPDLQALHRELLAADHPVRSGVRFGSASLVGRDDDIRSLRALVRDARVVSILGPGGLGKTRLAHLLARTADQPVVHFVELVGIGSPDDVIGEVGSALGVRDSVAGRRTLTPEQRRDVRARIAQQLDGAPTLLVLDNCEHVVTAAADLVAFLVATAPQLHVVTTTRAPLGIAAERVFPLAQLDEDAAAQLFGQRARAARPGVRLDEETVRRVVRRLDGLPLAIELAAAKVRVMSVEDVDRRLDDRFALLRGSDRSAPDRHQTLLAVIDWSWNLLAEPERRALRRWSTFHDGFTLPAAGALVGNGDGDGDEGDALDLVTALVDQSLLGVGEDRGPVRYRMLETVREFGRMQLVGAGEDADAEAAQLAWARAFAAHEGAGLTTARQVEAVDAVRQEENNLADCLRRALAAGDAAAVADLMATLGSFWTITGENPRVIVLASAVDAAFTGWEPSAGEVETAVAAAALVAMNTIAGELADVPACLGLLVRRGDEVTDPSTRAMAEVIRCQDPADPVGSVERLQRLGSGPDRRSASLALMWASHHRENGGDPEAAIELATRGLAHWRPEDGPWLAALLGTLVGSLHAQLGRHDEAAAHLRGAIPGLDRLGARDDAVQARSLLAVAAVDGGRLDEAEAILAELEQIGTSTAGLGGPFVISTLRAELALARGRVQEGLDQIRAAIVQLRALTFPGLGVPSGLEPWALFGESSGLTAYAVHTTGSDGSDLAEVLTAKLPAVLEQPHLDYPVAGAVLHALGAWGLLRGSMPREEAVRLLVLAERFSYARYSPTMHPRHTDAPAERLAPGLLATVRSAYGPRRGPELLDEARALASRLG